MPRGLTRGDYRRAQELGDSFNWCSFPGACETCLDHARNLLEEAGEEVEGDEVEPPEDPCQIDSCSAASFANDPNRVHAVCAEDHAPYVCGVNNCGACMGYDPMYQQIRHDEPIAYCGQCSEWVPMPEMVNDRGVTACSSCWADHDLCDSCANLRETDTLEEIRLDGNMRNTCEVCRDSRLTQCSECGGYTRYPNEHAHTGAMMCRQCWANEHWHCDNCRIPVHVDDDHMCGRINSYSYTPPLHFYGDHPDELYIGMELEVENARGMDSTPMLAGRFEGYMEEDVAWMTRDGSLSDGFEIVTHPMTPKAFRDTFKWEALRDLKDHGMRGTQSCGIHLHVNRDAFHKKGFRPKYRETLWENGAPPIREYQDQFGYVRREHAEPFPQTRDASPHLYKFLKFLYRNPNECQVIGERGSVNYSRWNAEEGQQVIKYAKDKGAANGGRYMAVNLQPENTIELRFFQATLDVERVQKNIEFVDALFTYTKQLTVKDIKAGGLDWPAFAQWAREWDRHHNLLNFMDREGLMPNA